MKRLAPVKPVLVVAMLGVGSAQAAPDAASVLEASPIDDIVEQYPAMLSQGIREGLKQRGQVPPMVADTVGYVVSSSFSADKIEQQIITDLQAQLTDEQLQAVSEWYQTPVARKISSAEIAASAPEAWPQIQASAPELNRKYKGTPKAEMFDRFDRAARATESAVDTTIAVQLGLATAMSALSSESMHYEQLERRIENQRGMLRRDRDILFLWQSPSPFIISDFFLAFARITVTSLSAVDLILVAISAPWALNSFASLCLSVCIRA